MSTAQSVIDALKRYDLKPEGSGQYRCNSPFRAGANSHSFAVTIDGDELGAFFDHNGGDSGSLYELATRLGIELPRLAAENSKKTYANLAEYAAHKGVDAAVYTAAGWVEEIYQQRPALKFPTKNGFRWRFLDGGKCSFINQKGYTACWYGLDKAIKIATETGQPLVICNGEPSTVVAQHHGLAACAVTNGEGKHIPGSLLQEIVSKWQGKIIIALDCDKAGRKGSSLFLQDFQNAGADAKAVDLMLGNKGDLADFCKLNGKESISLIPTLPALLDVQLALPAAEGKALDAAPVLPLQTLVDELVKARKTAERKEDRPLDDLLDTIQAEVDRMRINEHMKADKALDDVFQEHTDWMIDAYNHAGAMIGFSTGINQLDELLGGIEQGHMWVLLAATGMGKTTLVSSIGASLINQAPGIIIPTELEPKYWINKLLAVMTRIPTDLIRRGRISHNQMAHIENMKALIQMRQTRIYQERSPSVDNALAFARNAIKNHGAKWAIVDCLSNIKATGQQGIFDNATAASNFAQELASLGLAVVSTSQVGRNLSNEKVKIPNINSGYGSGVIENNADVLLGLYRHDYYVVRGDEPPKPEFPEGTMLVRCLKHRHEGNAEGRSVSPFFIGGVGVYDEQI